MAIICVPLLLQLATSNKDNLEYVEDSQNTQRFLQDIVEHPQKQACLMALTQSRNFIHWLRRTTKG